MCYTCTIIYTNIGSVLDLERQYIFLRSKGCIQFSVIHLHWLNKDVPLKGCHIILKQIGPQGCPNCKAKVFDLVQRVSGLVNNWGHTGHSELGRDTPESILVLF